MTSFVRFLNVNTQLTPASTTGSTSKQVLLFGQRFTNGVLTTTTNGFAQPNFYVPILLPSFPDGKSALTYLKNYGIRSQMGINITLSFPAPNLVVSSNSLTTITWASIPTNFSQLTGFNLSGILTQTTLNSNIYSASIIDGVATMIVYGTIAYTTTDVMTLSGVNNINYPDPNATDPIALMVWDFYETALSANTSAAGAPSCYISILSNRDLSIDPTPTAISLVAPTITDVSGTTTILTYAIDAAGLGYLPTTSYGSTVVSQVTSLATGTYGGFSISDNTVKITITDVSGTFSSSNPISIVLDNNINGFNFLDGVNLYGAVLQFPISSLSDITTNQKSFFDGIALLNQGNQVLNSHYGTYGIAGNIYSLPSAAPSLPAPNNQNYVLATYPYIYKYGNVPYDRNVVLNVASGRVASAVMYMLANGEAPFPPLMTATINHLPVSSVASTTSYSNAQNGSADIAINRGWLPLAPNSSGAVSFLESNTTLITIPGTTTPDIEFRYTHIWDCIRYIKQNVAELFNTISILPNNQGSALMSTTFLRQFREGILSILYTAQNIGVVENVALYQNLVTVTQDTLNPNQVDAYIPSQIIPQVNGANVTINVFSSLYTFSNSQGV